MRIVHDNTKIIMTIEDDSVRISTPYTVYKGSEAECQAEIERLNLQPETDMEGLYADNS